LVFNQTIKLIYERKIEMRFKTALGAKLARECRRDINQTIRRQQQNQIRYGTIQSNETEFNGLGCIAIVLLIIWILFGIFQ